MTDCCLKNHVKTCGVCSKFFQWAKSKGKAVNGLELTVGSNLQYIHNLEQFKQQRTNQMDVALNGPELDVAASMKSRLVNDV